jgi:hypothetical protein
MPLVGLPLLYMSGLSNRDDMIQLTLRAVIASLSILFILVADSQGQEAGWTSNSYYDNSEGKWIVEVSSTLKRWLHCTIIWHATRAGRNDQGGGTSIGGQYVLTVPPYSGVGPASRAAGGVSGVGNFNYKILSD